MNVLKRKYLTFKKMDFFDFYNLAHVTCSKIKTRWIYGMTFGRIGKGAWIKKPEQIFGASRLNIGAGVRIERGAILYAVKYYAGKDYTGTIEIGKKTFANKHFNATSAFGIHIGDEVVFGPNVFLTDFDHGYEDIRMARLETDLVSKGPISIGDRCWLGANVFVGSGVSLGEYCVVAANSVVTKSFPAFSVIAGSPAKVVKRYDPEQRSWVKVNNKI
ncbi:acyltransferase [Janthinobacterium sp. MDB2-8]|uniref:acyltransferase n=1 Tax=Janthinobacterium sp. MDB2-8 TaxID=1259338 RepID=UPI003F27A2BF